MWVSDEKVFDFFNFSIVYCFLKGYGMVKNKKIEKNDDKLLKKEKSWRRARIGAVVFAFVFVFVLFTSDSSEDKESLIYSSGWLLFWLLVIDWLNMRIRHITSIKHYKEIIMKLQEEKGN